MLTSLKVVLKSYLEYGKNKNKITPIHADKILKNRFFIMTEKKISPADRR